MGKIVDEDIKIQSQEINLQRTTKQAIYLRDIQSAELIVQHKNGKTRFYVKNIKSYSPLDTEPDNIDGIVINKKREYLENPLCLEEITSFWNNQ